MTPRKRGRKRRLSNDSSNSEGESLDSRTPLKNDQSGRRSDGRHGYHPSCQPNRHHHTGCHQWPCERGEEKPPTGQQAEDCANSAEIQPCPQTEAGIPLQKAWKTGTTIPKPARRQLPQEAIPAEYPGTSIRGLPASDPRLRQRIGQVRQALHSYPPWHQVRQARTMATNLLRSQTYLPYNVAMQRARDEMPPKAPPPAQPASAAVDNCWSRDRTAPSSLSADTGTPVLYAKVAARGGTANRGPSRKNPINPPPGQSSQAAARVPDGKHQSVAKGGHSKEVTARLDQLTRWERPIISPLESNPPMTLESPDGVEDSLTADDTKGEDHQRRGETGCPPVPAGPRAAKEPGSGEENPRADHQNRRAHDGTDQVTERVQRRPTAGDTVLRRFPVETDARTDSGQAE